MRQPFFGVSLFICDSTFREPAVRLVGGWREGRGNLGVGGGGAGFSVFFCSYRAVVMVLMMGRHASKCPVISFLSH